VQSTSLNVDFSTVHMTVYVVAAPPTTTARIDTLEVALWKPSASCFHVLQPQLRFESDALAKAATRTLSAEIPQWLSAEYKSAGRKVFRIALRAQAVTPAGEPRKPIWETRRPTLSWQGERVSVEWLDGSPVGDASPRNVLAASGDSSFCSS
jgi:hypothetical protein